MKYKEVGRNMKSLKGLSVGVFTLLLGTGEALAASPNAKAANVDIGEVGDPFTTLPDGTIDGAAPSRFLCNQAKFWKEEMDHSEAAIARGETMCLGPLAEATHRASLKKASEALLVECAPKVDDGAATGPDKSAVQVAQNALLAAEAELKEATDKAEAAKKAHAELVDLVGRLGNKATPQDLALVVERKQAVDSADRLVTEKQTMVGEKRNAVVTATSTLAAEGKAANEAAAKFAKAKTTFNAALAVAQHSAKRSPVDFEAKVDNTAWMDACSGLRSRQLKAGVLSSADASENAESAAKAARATDVLRKAASVPSVVGGGGGFLETGGAPDRVVYSLFSALGADQKTNGTQMLMTLNLGQVWPGNTPIEDQPAWIRNLFVRATVPLTATKEVPVGGGETSEAASGTPPNVSRMSFVVGTSLSDNTDPRVAANRPCYLSVLSYAPFPQSTTEGDTSAEDERKDYFDVCNRRAANRHRLALRLGVGLVVNDDDAQTTDVEYLSGVAVWAPASWVYVNALYQRLLLPTPRHLFGGGVSTSFNVAGSSSGVDSWARLGLDLLVLGVRDDATRTTDIETRLTATARLKLPESSIITFGIGPRLLGSALEDPGILASVGLSYDADLLLEPLLQPAPSKP